MLLIKNGRVVDPKSGFDQVADVLVDGKKVVKIADAIEEADAEVIDATGLVVAPGLVDIHVHFREPGQTHKEDIHTGALAAAAGGFTSVVMMANTNPTISDVETLKEVLVSAAKENVHVYTNATVTKNFDGKTLTDFKALLENGALSFSDDGIPLQSTKVLKEALDLAKANNTFVAVHEEDPELNGILGFNEGIARDKFHFCGATGVAEYSMIARDVMIAYDRGAHLHIQHLSKAESVKVVEFAQQLGANVTAEAAPQHFSKTEDLLLIKGSAAKMNPPLRTEKDRLAVIEGLKSGVISVIATDHAPHGLEEKSKSFLESPFGIVGSETAFQLIYTHFVETNRFTLEQVINWMATKPAEIFQLEAGTLTVGAPADVAIFDIEHSSTIDKKDFLSKGENTPFVGWNVKGETLGTFVDGKLAWHKGE